MRLYLFLTFFCFFYCNSSKPKNDVYDLIGYRNGRPIFKEISSNELFVLSDKMKIENFSFYGESSINKLRYINDCVVVSELTESSFLLSKNSVKLNFQASDVVVSEDCSIVALYNQDTISVYSDNVLQKKFAGRHPNIAGANIYYNGGAENPGFIRLMKISALKEDKPLMIVEDIFDEGLLVINDRFIACQIPKTGGPLKAVYDTFLKKFKVIQNQEITDGNYYPLYLPLSNKLIYYKPEGLEIIDPEITLK